MRRLPPAYDRVKLQLLYIPIEIYIVEDGAARIPNPDSGRYAFVDSGLRLSA